MQIGPAISLYDVKLSADPSDLSSSESFRLSFRIWSPQFTPESHDQLWTIFKQSLPALRKYVGWGDSNSEVLDVIIDGHADLCKHFVDMFRRGGVEVTSNGYAYQEHPLFKSIPAPENMPSVFRNFDSLKALVCSTIIKDAKLGQDEAVTELSGIRSHPAGTEGRLDALNS